MARILILDGHCSAALAFVRSLGRADHWVAVATVSGLFAPATKSRYCKVRKSYPDPLLGVDTFVSTIERHFDEYGFDLVIPMSEATVWPLIQSRKLVIQHKVGAPSESAIELVSDKYRTVLMASTLNLPVPKTLLIKSVEDLDESRHWDFPIVIKDRFSTNWIDGRGVSGGVDFAYNFDDLVLKIKKKLKCIHEVLIQSFFPGEGVGFSCLVLEGKIFFPFQWRRLREKDPRGSGSSARISVAVDNDILSFSSKLLLKAGFQGLVMVEYKRNTKTGELSLMEINGRPWGSMQLPICCGVNYPVYYVDFLLGNKAHPDLNIYKCGLTCRWLAADLTHLENLWNGKPEGWPLDYPNLFISILQVLIPWYPGLRYDHLSLDDPLPGIVDLNAWFFERFKGKISGYFK